MSNRRFQIYFFAAVMLVSLALTVLVFRPYLVLLAFGGVFAILSRPIHRAFFRLVRSESVSALLTIIVGTAALVVPVAYFLIALYGELSGLFSSLHIDLGAAGDFIERHIPAEFHGQVPLIMDEFGRLLRGVGTALSGNLVGLFSDVATVTFDFFVVLIAAYYLLRDGTKVKRLLLQLSPLGDKYDEQIFRRVIVAVRAVMGGVLMIGVLKAVLTSITFAFCGVPTPIFWGVMAGLASMVPVVGTAIVTVPAIGYLLMYGHYVAAVVLLLVSIFFIGTVDNFLQPKLVESKTNIHPLLILLSILGGFKFYGFAGFVLGPLTLAMTMALFDVYRQEFRQEADAVVSDS